MAGKFPFDFIIGAALETHPRPHAYLDKLFKTEQGGKLRRAVRDKLTWCVSTLPEIPRPRVMYYEDTITAGLAKKQMNIIGFNARALCLCTDFVAGESVCHEYAHLVCDHRYPPTRKEPDYHGPLWLKIMGELGFPNAAARFEGSCMVKDVTESMLMRDHLLFTFTPNYPTEFRYDD